MRLVTLDTFWIPYFENFKVELQLIMVANSTKLLIKKNALLEATVSLEIDGVRLLSCVLDTSTKSINIALSRRVYASNTKEMVLGLCLHRKKRRRSSNLVKLLH